MNEREKDRTEEERNKYRNKETTTDEINT